MDIAGLLDDVAELAKKRNWTEKALGGGIRGATLRGLLGFDAPEDATSTEREAWRTGQALSNTPTPLALAAAPAALAKASKATKALPREQALETARQNAVKMLGLPESNTAMDRAKAMGFDIKVFHGTGSDFPSFERGKSSFHTIGSSPSTMEWVSKEPEIASGYALSHYFGGNPQIIPLLLKSEGMITKDMKYKKIIGMEMTDSAKV